MRRLITDFAAGTEGDRPAYVVFGAVAAGRRKPSKNPRYLQVRPDLADPRGTAAALTAVRLARGFRRARQSPWLDVVAAGRRNNLFELGRAGTVRLRPCTISNCPSCSRSSSPR